MNKDKMKQLLILFILAFTIHTVHAGNKYNNMESVYEQYGISNQSPSQNYYYDNMQGGSITLRGFGDPDDGSGTGSGGTGENDPEYNDGGEPDPVGELPLTLLALVIPIYLFIICRKPKNAKLNNNLQTINNDENEI